MALVQEGRTSSLSRRLEIFRKNETTECPYCYQKVTSEYKNSLVESIEKVLNKEVEDHQRLLERYKGQIININLDPYRELNGYQPCIDLAEKINSSIQANNENLDRKINNPYEPVAAKLSFVKMLATQLFSALENLEKARKGYNDRATKTGPIINALNSINGQIAHYDIIDLFNQYTVQVKEYENAKQAYDMAKGSYDRKKTTVEYLEAQRKNVILALDEINACMKYIFFSEDRLKIEYVDGVYKLISHGKSVRPSDVSVGERNILGLSYFFTSILEGQDEKTGYSEEYLLVIDDPVSSYDAENRIGILSFLKYKLDSFLEGNMNTKVLVMTHDLGAFYDIHKIFQEIIKVCKQKNYPNAPKFNCFEIIKGELKPFSYNKRQEYTEIVKAVYTYAQDEDDGYKLVIGNMMRQMLEAFSTFEYKKGIEEVSTDEEILALLGKPEYILYYKNLMYRLVLHGGSHKEEQVKAMNDFQFFSLISDIEKKRTAKDILCFIYLLNKRHLLEHLNECKDVESTLDTWCLDIKTRAVVM